MARITSNYWLQSVALVVFSKLISTGRVCIPFYISVICVEGIFMRCCWRKYDMENAVVIYLRYAFAIVHLLD